MKKLLLILLSFLALNYCSAQNTFPPNGNAGIGTLNPGNNLGFPDVNAGSGTSGITWYNPNPLDYGIHRTAGDWINPNYQQLRISWQTGVIIDPGSTYGKSYLEIAGSGIRISPGNVGIGTMSPIAKLQIGAGTTNMGSNIAMFSDASLGGPINALSLVNNAAAGTGNEVDLTFHTASNYSPTGKIGAIAGAEQPTTDLAFYTYKANIGLTEKLRILGNGYVGIGTTSPDQALTVKGTVHSNAVIVDTNIFPDYVFDKDYDLTSLKDLKTYINQNHHLPEIPSAAQVAKDGINLGEMNAKLLKKIEELTLYLIEKDKESEAQKKVNQTLQDQINQLNTKVSSQQHQ